MPIGGYPDFATCVAAQKRRGKSDDSAHKICGWLEQRAKKHANMARGSIEKQFADAGLVQLPNGVWVRPDSVAFAEYQWDPRDFI